MTQPNLVAQPTDPQTLKEHAPKAVRRLHLEAEVWEQLLEQKERPCDFRCQAEWGECRKHSEDLHCLCTELCCGPCADQQG